MTDLHDAKTMGDGAAVALSLAGAMGWMTPMVTLVSSILGIVYLGIRIWETDTVQKLVGKNAKYK
jgi:hypothetical protein